MPQPPLLPEVVLARVHRLAMLDGMGVVFLAGLYALSNAADGIPTAAVIGLLGAGAGALELHGAALLRHGQPRGISWLIGSQPFLLCVIWAYCAYKLHHFEMLPIPETFQDSVRLAAAQLGMSEEEYARFVYRLTYGALAIVSFFYQGGMTYYYFTRRHGVSRALGEE